MELCWQSACLAHTRPWVQSTALQKTGIKPGPEEVEAGWGRIRRPRASSPPGQPGLLETLSQNKSKNFLKAAIQTASFLTRRMLIDLSN